MKLYRTCDSPNFLDTILNIPYTEILYPIINRTRHMIDHMSNYNFGTTFKIKQNGTWCRVLIKKPGDEYYDVLPKLYDHDNHIKVDSVSKVVTLSKFLHESVWYSKLEYSNIICIPKFFTNLYFTSQRTGVILQEHVGISITDFLSSHIDSITLSDMIVWLSLIYVSIDQIHQRGDKIYPKLSDIKMQCVHGQLGLDIPKVTTPWQHIKYFCHVQDGFTWMIENNGIIPKICCTDTIIQISKLQFIKADIDINSTWLTELLSLVYQLDRTMYGKLSKILYTDGNITENILVDITKRFRKNKLTHTTGIYLGRKFLAVDDKFIHNLSDTIHPQHDNVMYRDLFSHNVGFDSDVWDPTTNTLATKIHPQNIFSHIERNFTDRIIYTRFELYPRETYMQPIIKNIFGNPRYEQLGIDIFYYSNNSGNISFGHPLNVKRILEGIAISIPNHGINMTDTTTSRPIPGCCQRDTGVLLVANGYIRLVSYLNYLKIHHTDWVDVEYRDATHSSIKTQEQVVKLIDGKPKLISDKPIPYTAVITVGPMLIWQREIVMTSINQDDVYTIDVLRTKTSVENGSKFFVNDTDKKYSIGKQNFVVAITANNDVLFISVWRQHISLALLTELTSCFDVVNACLLYSNGNVAMKYRGRVDYLYDATIDKSMIIELKQR
jgi:hypothetical protein